MGNASSVDLELNLKNDIREQSPDAIAWKITHTHKECTKLRMLKLAKVVFKAASGQENDSRITKKYAKLVALLSGLTVPDPKNVNKFVTFKDVLIGLVTKHVLDFSESSLLEYDTIETSFMGELFIADVCSAGMMLRWLHLLEGFPWSRQELLGQIRKKVETEVKKPVHEKEIDKLNDMLNTQGSGPVPAMVPSTSSAVAREAPSTSTSFSQAWNDVPTVNVQPYINATAPADDEESPPPYGTYAPAFNYSADGEVNSGFDFNYGWALPSRSASISSYESLPDQFAKFLSGLKQNPSQEFDLDKFEACSEDDRKKCAQLVLDAVIADAKLVELLARMMQTIQCTHPPEDVDHLAFMDHLSVLAESQIDNLVKQTWKWESLENIGNFLALLYNFECITNVTMKKWFDGLQPFVASNNVKGTNVYILVLQSSLEQMQFKNPTKFKFHVLQLQNLQPTVWLSPELIEWKRDFLRFHLEDVLSMTSNMQQVNGAIRKIPTYPRMTSNADDRNPFVMLQLILNAFDSEQDLEQTLKEIVALEIEISAKNLRRITNMMTAKVAGHPEVKEICAEVLVKLPAQSVPPFDSNEIKDPLKLSILDHLFSLQKDAKFPRDRFKNILGFMNLVHDKNLIGTETIAEIIETLSMVARPDDKKTLVTVVASLLDAHGASLMTQGVALKETQMTLEKQSESKYPEIRKLAVKALQVISQEDDATFHESLECASLRNFTSVRIENKERFFEFLLELPSKSFNDTKLMLSKIKSQEHCEEFTAAFYEAAMKTEQFLLFARFAQIIENEFGTVGISATFKKSLVQILFTPYSPMGQEQMKGSKMIGKRVKFIGELYKIKWVDIEGLTTVLDMLSETEVLVQLFHTLLNIVELTIAQNGDGEELVKYRRLYVRRQDGYMDSTSDYLICLEVVEMLSEIATLSGKRFVFDADTIKTIMDDLNMKNVGEQAMKIESMSEGTKKEFEMVVSAILEKLAECDDDRLMASFSSKLLEVFKDSKAQLKEKFVDKCLKLLIAKYLRGRETESNNSFSTIEFFGKLYMMNVVSSNFIALCCEILFAGENENKNNCLCILLSAVGAKFEAEDSDAVTKVFENFEDYLAEQGSESYLAENLRNLIELRKNGWKAAGFSQSPLQQAIVFLKNLTRSHLSSEVTCAEVITLSKTSRNELVVSFYFSVLQNPSKAELYADLCDIINKQDPEFINHLNDYLQSSVKGLFCLQNHEYDEDTLRDLAAVTIFIGELFALDLIDDDSFASLLKPAKNLRFDAINQLSAIVSDKVNATDNNPLKEILMSLEDIAQNDSNHFWEDLKKDIDERSFQ